MKNVTKNGCIVICYFVTACGSFDLGSEKTVEVKVDIEKPNWNADIQRLMTVKCMDCHSEPRPSHAPTNTPAINFARESVFKQAGVLNRIWTRVFRTASDPMPPIFGNQLTSSEKLALKNYLIQNGVDTTVSDPVEKDSKSDTSAIQLSSAFADNCAGCHGVAGAGGDLGKKLSNTSLTESTYLSKVRNGVANTNMKSFASSKISDADLKTDYAAFKAAK